MAHHPDRTPHDAARNDPHLRGGLSPDYTDPEPASARSGATHERMPAKRKGGGRSRAGLWVGLFAAVVVGLLVSRMPFLAGSLNAGAPVDEIATASVSEDGRADAVDVSSALPEPDAITPSDPPATD